VFHVTGRDFSRLRPETFWFLLQITTGVSRLLDLDLRYNFKMLRYAIVLLMCLGACATAGGPPPATSASPLLSSSPPRLDSRTVAGDRFGAANTQGKVTVVKFFADYCQPCKRSLPELVQLAKENPKVTFLGVSLDEDPALTIQQVQRYGMNFPVIHDAGSVLAGRFRVTHLPMVFVLDGTGKVSWVGGPEQPEDALRRMLAHAKP
jgi:thiol-disulfide isomerase/thioredoxin